MITYYDRKIEDAKAYYEPITEIELAKNSNLLRIIIRLEREKREFLKEIARDHEISFRGLLKVILEDFITKWKKNDLLFQRFGI